MRYVGNAFAVGMLDEPEVSGTSTPLTVTFLTADQARSWLDEGEWESCVGHADTALLMSAMLGVDVPMRRVSTSLHAGDELLVAAYTGPRLPEGAIALPEGAKLRWRLIHVYSTAHEVVSQEMLQDMHHGRFPW
jgi:Domain of unknown function (DUF1874)